MTDSTHGLFRRLNDDVLYRLFDELRPSRGLRSLSTTCRWIRSACMPVLFRACIVKPRKSITEPEQFLPPSIWPYVRTLYISDDCPDRIAMRDRPHWQPYRLRYATHPLICGVLDSSFLKDALRAMPQLHSVTAALYCNEIHGIGWDTLEAILSAPHIRHFTLLYYLLNPLQSPPAGTRLDPLAPLTTFCYELHANRLHPRSRPSETEALAIILAQLHRSLESIDIPSESAPLSTLSSQSWPKLHTLKLSGEYPTGLLFPLVSILAGMPRLRVLALKLALPDTVGRQSIWPRGFISSFPCSELEDLSVSFPDITDEIYAHLPPSLRRLSLQCSPHHCMYVWEPEEWIVGWGSPILLASEMLQLLRRCRPVPLLDHLQVEYRADGMDEGLLEHIGDAYPRLTSLVMHRFRGDGDDDVPIISIGRALSALRCLRILRAHLDFPETPERSMTLRVGPRYTLTSSSIAACREMLEGKAAILARVLGPPLEQLSLLRRDNRYAEWMPFRLVASDGEGSHLRAVYDQTRADPECLAPYWM